jgi:CO/xanthine dehydrogenase FAD-binding subunit
MITEYHRPSTLEEALKLLSQPNTRPLGGGTILTQKNNESFAVVDLQALGLDKIRKSGDRLEIGASATLSLLFNNPHVPPGLIETLRVETPLNLRNAGTIAGTLVACDGRSPFATAMLALDAILILAPVNEKLTLGNFLPLRAGADGHRSPLQGKLITKIEIPLNAKLAFEIVARTPADRPIVCVALAQWPSGRTRLALGGWGQSPTLAMDGNEASGVETAASNAAAEASDEWASAEYRSDVAAVLAKRCLDAMA